MGEQPPFDSAEKVQQDRPNSWKWTVCGVLLLASAINYMDRQTLANASVRITKEFHLSETQYGNIEAVFAYAFAIGSLVFGWLADRVSVRWLYAGVLALWSAAGFAAGLTHSYDGLLLCRAFLGFFEAGHWPCGIRTTRALLDARQRSMGNSVLQSGTSVGAIITPLIMAMLMTSAVGSWRIAFQVVGVIGFAWIGIWLRLVRDSDFAAATPLPQKNTGAPKIGIWQVLLSRRMLVVFVVIACINTTFQLLRAWLPKILQTGHGYSERDALIFNSVWFGATDVGCIAAGAFAVWLGGRAISVHSARLIVFGGCALMSACTVFVPWLPSGWPLLLTLLVVGAGALGLFPIYHAFTQDISGEHQGRITGIAGIAAWIVPAQAQRLFGNLVDSTGSYDHGLAIAGLLPLIAFANLWAFWGKQEAREL